MLLGADGALRSPGTFLVWMPSKNADQFALSVVSAASEWYPISTMAAVLHCTVQDLVIGHTFSPNV